jgi:hypothetical protein
MFGRVTSIPTMGSYEYALKKFNSTTPIRGRNTIPLGERRSHDRYYMEKRGESIWCYYHRTPVLKIHPGNIYEIDVEGWHTQTTARVLHRLLPGAGVCMIDGWITVACYNQGYFPIPDGGMKFTTGESGLGHFTPIDPKRQVIHRINRKKANAVRRQYAAFMTYAKGFLKLRQDEHGTVRFASEEFKNAGLVVNRVHDDTLHRWIEGGEPMEHYQAVLSLARESYWVMPVVVHESTVRRKINDFILKLHASEVLERIELPLGEVKRDPYKTWL